MNRADQAVIATVGHVDHGKSTLLRALTGMDPGRQEPDRRRGLSSDLGFAWLTLPSGQQLAFVDVPGHERFVPDLLAGVGPVPAVLFVVAADEGWKPQSTGHLAVLDALGIRHGLLAVTRADLADPGPALTQAAGLIAATSLGEVEAVAVSAITGEGMPGLVDALTRLADSIPVPDPGAPVRIWVDSAFTTAGGATVVRGTLPAGTVRRGDELVITPSMRPVRLQGIQSLGEPAAGLTGPARAAFSLHGANSERLSRGMALVHPGRWTLADVIDVRLLLPGTPPADADGAPHPHAPHPDAPRPDAPRPVPPRPHAPRPRAPSPPATTSPPATSPLATSPLATSPLATSPLATSPLVPRLPRALTLHVGAARTVARVRQLSSRIARLTLREPLPLHVGDRVLLRDPGARAGWAHAGWPSVLGATVLDLAPPSLARRGAGASAGRELASWPELPAAADLLRRHGLLRASALLAMGISAHPEPVCGEWLADPGHWADLASRLGEAVTAQAGRDPLGPGLPLEEARVTLGLPDRRLVEALLRPPLRVRDGMVQLAEPFAGAAAAGLPANVAAAVQLLLADLAAAPFAAPDALRLRQLGLDIRAITAAERAGLLLRISDQIVLTPGADAQAGRILAGLPQPFTAAEARQALQTTRRVAIPLLEFLDRAGVTQRLPDDRRRLPAAVSPPAG